MAADPIGLLVAGHASDVGVEVATQTAAALSVVVVVDQVAQACPAALGDLAELLDRPAEALAELVRVHAERDLACDDQPLVGREVLGELAQATEVVTSGDVLIDGSRRVGELRERRRLIGAWTAIASP